jgi:oligopeptide transport system substrate-binding protein
VLKQSFSWRLRAITVCALSLSACGEKESGPIVVSAIGGAPAMTNPNRAPPDMPSALLLETTAQGLVRFDASGQIEPALAQSWIVSDDGLRYTFRLARADWADGQRVTAEQVAERLKAAASRASRNPLKPLLGAIDEIVAMTDDVLEISLKAPRPAFLQLLAQPEMGLVRAGNGTGPFSAGRAKGGAMLLTPRQSPDAEEDEPPAYPDILLRGEAAATAVARFEAGGADYVTGGTIGNLPLVRTARVAADTLQFDPAEGLFGLFFIRLEGFWAGPEARRALAMAVDRGALATALQIPEFRVRTSLLPGGLADAPPPALPGWAGAGLEERRTLARQTLAAIEDAPEGRPAIRIAVPDAPGHRLLFALIRRDWRAIGVDAVRVAEKDEADLRFIDAVAPAGVGTWYLRSFSCEVQPVCDAETDALLADARATMSRSERLSLLAEADRRMEDAAFFIPLGSPVRWSLVAQRLNGFRPNIFAQHPLGELIVQR